MGHRWAKPEWAIFFWADYRKALNWAVYQYCRRNTTIKVLYHIPTGKFAVRTKQFNDLIKAVNGKHTYVYTKTLPVMKVGFGSSPDIEEYTYNKEVIPDKTDDIVLDRLVLLESVIVMTDQQFSDYYDDLVSGKFKGARGFIYRLIMDSERDMLRHKYHEKVKSGELNPGDDLSEVSLEHIPASFRW